MERKSSPIARIKLPKRDVMILSRSGRPPTVYNALDNDLGEHKSCVQLGKRKQVYSPGDMKGCKIIYP